MSSESATRELGTWTKAVPLLAMAGLLAYANSFTKAFIFDDLAWIVVNPDLADASRYLSGANRPVVNLSILLNNRLGGLNPTGYHAFNLAVHILAGLTLYGLIRRVLLLPRCDGRYERTAPYLAFAVALLWLVHPLQTQAVTYVIQRAESMMGLFYLFTFYAWLRGATGGGRLWYVVGVGSFGLCCGCKEVSATLPPLLVIFDRIFFARSWRESIRDRWLGYLAIAAIWGFTLRSHLASALGAGAAAGIGFQIKTATPYQYLLTQSEVILHYLRLSLVPLNQTVDYLDWPIARSLGEVWPAFAVVSLLLATSIVLLFVRPTAGFVGLWFFAILAPTSSIMPIIDPVFEHRMYLSLASVAVAVVFGIHAILQRLQLSERLRIGLASTLLATAACCSIALTYSRNESYRSIETALEDNIAKRPNNPRPISSLAIQYLSSNEMERAGELIDRGLALQSPFTNLLIRQKAPWLAHQGRYEEAEQYYRLFLTYDYNPFTSPLVYRDFAWLLIARGRPAEAEDIVRQLMVLQPDTAENWLLFAAVELAEGRESQARKDSAEAMRLDPNIPKSFGETARALAFAAESKATPLLKPRALRQAEVAVLADGDRDPRLLDTLAMVYAWNGEFAKAAAAAKRGATAAESRGDEDWARVLKSRTELYEAGKRYTAE